MSELLRPEQPNPENKTIVYDELVELYPLWRDALLHGDTEAKEKQVKFLNRLLSNAGVKSVIDLGGGIGTHSLPLAEAGYEVTDFDSSDRALKIASLKSPAIKTIQGRFEDINLEESFDASICMWSTINYLMKPEDRQHFAEWMMAHTGKLIIIDQPNVLSYPKTFSKEYENADRERKLKISRKWEIADQVRKTDYTYEITDNGGTRIVQDAELQYFMTLDETKALIGPRWSAKHILGDYNTNEPFDQASSHRLVTVFEKI